MARKALEIKAGGQTFRLRLTVGGQRRLKEKLDADAMSVILAAGGDVEYMTALLTEALNWTDSGNSITDGEELYDLLVDEGYAGQGKFGKLAVDIGVCSGLMESKDGKKVSDLLIQRTSEAFDRLADLDAGEEENPTRAKD
ncbi:MAG: hypothetical protein LUH36_08505 [Oscillospiraceae bacterium]|nr:hypothetical protein [Oscillospiraceae bacterium]